MRIDVLARRWGGPDGGPDGMAVAAAYFAWTLAELGHTVHCYTGASGVPPWTHPLVEWRQRSPLFVPDDWSADLVVTVMSPAWRRTAKEAEAAGAKGRLCYWHHHGLPPEGQGFLLAAPPVVKETRGWARTVVLPPSSWAVEARGERTGAEVLVPGAGRSKGGPVALAVAHRCPDLRFYVLPGRSAASDLAGWRRARNAEVAPGPVTPQQFLSRARVVLSPTHAEVHPLTLVEAAVRGIPIVCTDLGATRHAAPGSAFLPVAAPPDAWAAAVRGALEQRPEPLQLRPYTEVVAAALEQLRPARAAAAVAPSVRPRPPVRAVRPVPARPRPAAPAVSRPATAARGGRAPSCASGRPRVLVLADVPNWAWARKAQALARCLADRIDVTVAYSSEHRTGGIIRSQQHDLYHTFEVCQVGAIPNGYPLVTGITAHVARNYDAQRGAGTVKAWADRAIGFHANSVMLQREMEQYLRRPVYYVPNGVDEAFWYRMRPRSSGRLVVGHVARPNPRKGADLVRDACRRAGVELRAIDRRAQNALSAEDMLEFYQGIHVLAVSSDMDGTPNPALEAAACGCAVVSNRIGNMPEFIEHGRNGLLTERTTDGLAAALESLAARPIAEVEEMGRAARATIERAWTWAHQAPAYAAMWERCIARPERAREAG